MLFYIVPGRSISLNYLGRLMENGRWKSEAKLLGYIQIDDQLELFWLLDSMGSAMGSDTTI